MKCCRCPLYHYWNNESDRGESCAIFGDGWDSPFQYEDKEGTTVGCYLDRHFIEKADAERDEYYESMAESIARDLGFTADTPQTDRLVTEYPQNGEVNLIGKDKTEAVVMAYDVYKELTEPQTDTEIAKAIVHKMIDDAVIAEDAYPDLRQKMHDAVDEYEPQTDCGWK